MSTERSMQIMVLIGLILLAICSLSPRLNGNQSHQGCHLRIPAGQFDFQKIKLYQYR